MSGVVRRTVFAVGSVVVAVVALGGSATAASSPAGTSRAPGSARAVVAQTASRAVFTVGGDVARPMRLTVSDLRRRWPRQGETVRFGSEVGTQRHTYRGALLTDVLTSAKPRFDAAVKNDPLRFAVRVGATDGYAAVVSWGEVDPAFGGTRVLLAVSEDHKPLTRPRLVVPGDLKGGRYVSDVNSVRLRRVW